MSYLQAGIMPKPPPSSLPGATSAIPASVATAGSSGAPTGAAAAPLAPPMMRPMASPQVPKAGLPATSLDAGITFGQPTHITQGRLEKPPPATYTELPGFEQPPILESSVEVTPEFIARTAARFTVKQAPHPPRTKSPPPPFKGSVGLVSTEARPSGPCVVSDVVPLSLCVSKPNAQRFLSCHCLMSGAHGFIFCAKAPSCCMIMISSLISIERSGKRTVYRASLPKFVPRDGPLSHCSTWIT